MRLRGIAVALLVLLAVPPTAWAQLRDKKAAAQHFKEGRALYDQSRWAEALAEFQSGYESFPLPGFLVNMGQCFRKLERLEEARDAWQKFIESNPGDGRLRYEVDEALAEVRGELEKRNQDEAERQRVAESKRRALIESIARQQQSELQAT